MIHLSYIKLKSEIYRIYKHFASNTEKFSEANQFYKDYKNIHRKDFQANLSGYE